MTPLSSRTLGLTSFMLLKPLDSLCVSCSSVKGQNYEKVGIPSNARATTTRNRDSTLVEGIKRLTFFQELKSLVTG